VAGTTVVCGLDRLSLRIVLALRALGERVTVVAESARPALLREAKRSGARVVEGSSEEIAQLGAVNLRSARCLVLTESADLGNLQVALAAREVNPDLRIVMRMFSTELAERASRLLPNSRVLSASREAAPYFAADALGLTTVPTRHVWGRHLAVHPGGAGDHFVDLGDGTFLAPIDPRAGDAGLRGRAGRGRPEHVRAPVHLWLVAEVWVRPGSRADGLGTAALERTGDLHVLAVRDRAEERWRPAHPDLLEAGHQVLLAEIGSL
jgi:hypothetical protein